MGSISGIEGEGAFKMADRKPLTPTDQEDLVAYLDNEADPRATERVQTLLDQNPTAREEKDLLEESWRMLDVLERPGAGPNFKDETASLAATLAYTDEQSAKSWTFLIWLGAVAAGFIGGWVGVSLVPDRNRETLRLLPILERYDGLRAAGSVEFLKSVHDKKLLPDSTNKASGEGSP